VSAALTDVALTWFAVSSTVWLALSAGVLLGRGRYERRARSVDSRANKRHVDKLIRRAERKAHTDWGRWRRIAALASLARMRHPVSPHLLYTSLADSDPAVAAAAARSLGSLGDLLAAELLVHALREGRTSRWRVAAQLERLAPLPGTLLEPLLWDPNPQVRLWGARLIGPYQERALCDLVALTRDEDPKVRAAAAEALGHRTDDDAADAVIALLDDPAWFVRAHAARAAGHVAGARAADPICSLLGEPRSWVRAAAKDALREIGAEAIPGLLQTLSSPETLARSGAAEVLQDLGLVDRLAEEDSESPLLAQIHAAGGPRLRETAEARHAELPWPGEERAA